MKALSSMVAYTFLLFVSTALKYSIPFSYYISLTFSRPPFLFLFKKCIFYLPRSIMSLFLLFFFFFRVTANKSMKIHSNIGIMISVLTGGEHNYINVLYYINCKM